MLKKIGFSLGLLILPLTSYGSQVSLPMVSLDKEPVSARALFGDIPNELLVDTESLYGTPDPELLSEEDLNQFKTDAKPTEIKSSIAETKKIEDSTPIKENNHRKITARNPEHIDTLKPKRLSSNIWFNEKTTQPKSNKNINLASSESITENEDNENISKQELLEITSSLKKELQALNARIDRNNNEYDELKQQIDNSQYAINIDNEEDTKLVPQSTKIPQLAKESQAFQKDEAQNQPKHKKIKKKKLKSNYNSDLADNDTLDFKQLSPSDLKKAFYKTYISENKHLSAYSDFDTPSSDINNGDDFYNETVNAFGSSNAEDSKILQQVKPLEVKIEFDENESSLSRDNYKLLSEYANMVANNSRKAIQISISERIAQSYKSRKLAAKRLAIVEQVLRDSGVSDKRIIPVLSGREDDAFVLRIISRDQYKTLIEKKRSTFGNKETTTEQSSLSW